jgi:hypothetical protein
MVKTGIRMFHKTVSSILRLASFVSAFASRSWSRDFNIWSIMRQTQSNSICQNRHTTPPPRVHLFCWNSCPRRYDCLLEPNSNRRDASASDLSKIDTAKVTRRRSRSSSYSAGTIYVPRAWNSTADIIIIIIIIWEIPSKWK